MTGQNLQFRAENLACRRGGRLIFSGLSFILDAGEALILTGANGAGKSSLIGIIAGRVEPAEGQIRIIGEAGRPNEELFHNIGHRDGLKPALTALENLDFLRILLGNPHLTSVAALEKVELAHVADIPVGYLSAGQKRRVALARLLVAKRPLWLLDEPTAALDTSAQRLLESMMADHRKDGGLIIAATHMTLNLAGAKEARLGVSAAKLLS